MASPVPTSPRWFFYLACQKHGMCQSTHLRSSDADRAKSHDRNPATSCLFLL